jgi:aspartate aminotransferase
MTVERAVDTVLEALAEHGPGASSWLVGSPCCEPPDVLRRAIRDAAASDHYDYTPVAGLPELREVLAEEHRREAEEMTPGHRDANGSRVTAGNIVVTPGAKPGLLALLAGLLSPGDEVLHPRPFYPAYPVLCRRLGLRPRALETASPAGPDGRGLGWSLEQLEAAISQSTRMLLLASPSNPTGATLSPEETRDLVDLCRRHRLWLVIDEAYHRFRFDQQSPPAAFDPEMEVIVELRSASKDVGLCGWRLGWVVAPEAAARRIASAQASLLNPPNTPSQMALCRIGEVPEEFFACSRRTVRARLRQLHRLIADCGLSSRLPDGGFYLWVDVRDRLGRPDGPGTSLELCRRLALDHGIGLWPGEDFGGAGWFRLSATAVPDSEWDNALERLSAALNDGGGSGRDE